MSDVPGSVPSSSADAALAASPIVPSEGKSGNTAEVHKHLQPGMPGYFNMLTKAIFVVGLNKCITPASLVLLSMIFLFIPLSVEAQHCFEQMAGGLLIYTWGVKCMSPIQEAFKKALVEQADPKWSKWVVPACGFGALALFSISSLFYISTAGDEIEGSVFMHGVVSSGDAPKCTDSGEPITTSTTTLFPLCPSPASTFGLLRKRPQRPHTAGAPCPKTTEMSLLPYFMGFALDAIMLVLVEPEEELVEMYQKIQVSYKACLVDLLVGPIAFSLDNFLAGAGVCSVVLAAADGSMGGAVGTFILFGLSTTVGVVIAFGVRGTEELLVQNGYKPVALWFKFSFLLWVALSFLDNGTSLVTNGLTFWVGLGGAFGWALFAMECCGEEGETQVEVLLGDDVHEGSGKTLTE